MLHYAQVANLIDFGCHIVVLPVGQGILVFKDTVHFHPLLFRLPVIAFGRSPLTSWVWGPRVVIREIQVRLVPFVIEF